MMKKMGVSVNGMVAILLGMQVLLLQYCATAQTVHVVGDSIGWTVPENSDAYDNWANQNNFAVGDILSFEFTTNAHDVVEVPKSSYDACNSNNNLTAIIATGPTNITLSTAGEHYYICTIGQHCANGQKLAITVSASSTSSPAPTSPGSVPPPPDSSASGVYASFFLVLLSIFIGMMC